MAMVFHFPLFCCGWWSWRLEARMLGALMWFWIIEDFAWFILNPAFGWARFAPETMQFSVNFHCVALTLGAVISVPRVLAPNTITALALRLVSLVRRTLQSGHPGRLQGAAPSWRGSTNNRTMLEPERWVFGLKPSRDAHLTAQSDDLDRVDHGTQVRENGGLIP
jgi:hypothetical protein